MTRKFPWTVKFICDVAPGGRPGVYWRVQFKGETSALVDGNASDRKQARSDAWHALEEMGLVTDGE